MKIKFQVVASFNYIEANADYAVQNKSLCQFLLYLHKDPTQFGCCVERFIQNHAQLENTLPLSHVVYVVCPFGVFFSCFHICIVPLVCFSSVFTFALSLWCVFFTMCFNVGSARRNYFHETVYGFHGLKMVIMVFSFNFKKLEK